MSFEFRFYSYGRLLLECLVQKRSFLEENLRTKKISWADTKRYANKKGGTDMVCLSSGQEREAAAKVVTSVPIKRKSVARTKTSSVPVSSHQSLLGLSFLFFILLTLHFHSIVAMAATTNKVCAVFGYGAGVGASVARKWASSGYSVAIMSRNLEKVQAAEKEIPNTKGYACDVSKPEDIEKTVTAIEKDLGPVHTLVYNAGSGIFKTWDTVTLDAFDMSMKANVHGLLSATQRCAPGMIERGEGCILITGATASLRGKPFTVGFAPAKGAQRLLAQGLARDLHPKNVHVGLFIIDGGIGPAGGSATDASKLDPNDIADTYWYVANQPKSCWSFETEIRPSVENW